MDYYISVLLKYADFEGRARRQEYWTFSLVNTIVIIILSIIGNLSKTPNVILSLYCLAVLVPYIAVSVRRLHDINKSGWYFFIRFIPVAGIIINLVYMIQDSDFERNAYGKSPKFDEYHYRRAQPVEEGND